MCLSRGIERYQGEIFQCIAGKRDQEEIFQCIAGKKVLNEILHYLRLQQTIYV